MNNFNNGDTALIHSTIDQALADMQNVSVDEKKEDIGMLGYPNPANALYTIEFSETVTNATVKVFDITGKIFSTLSFSNTNRLPIDVSGFTQGMYYIRVETNEQNQTFSVQITND
ncbi:MAG: T9SS type A sorting domain-containing protein [Flavobacteriales bacterium]